MTMPTPKSPRRDNQESALQVLFRAIASGDRSIVALTLARDPVLAQLSAATGATRQDAASYYFEAIARYTYAGDTALHIAAAAYAVDIAEQLVSGGARIRAVNRRGAEALHYATDGIPVSPHWNPDAQFAVIQLLIKAGAEPNATDKDGATPLHRAVRTRCADAVRALLAHGADARASNKAGSTPLHLAVQNTGRSGSGSQEAQAEQLRIIGLLLDHGARASDKDVRGKSVADCVKSAWIQELLERRNVGQ